MKRPTIWGFDQVPHTPACTLTEDLRLWLSMCRLLVFLCGSSIIIYLHLSVFSETGYVDMTGVVPDSITTWEATAFALNEKTGLGIAEMPSNVRLF